VYDRIATVMNADRLGCDVVKGSQTLAQSLATIVVKVHVPQGAGRSSSGKGRASQRIFIGSQLLNII